MMNGDNQEIWAAINRASVDRDNLRDLINDYAGRISRQDDTIRALEEIVAELKGMKVGYPFEPYKEFFPTLPVTVDTTGVPYPPTVTFNTAPTVTLSNTPCHSSLPSSS